MSFLRFSRPAFRRLLVVPIALGLSLTALASPAPDTRLIDPAELAKLLPAPAGWVKGEARTSQVDISATCSYTTASVTYTRDDQRLKVTIADTDAHQEGLLALVPMIMTLPDGHTDTLEPATTIARLKIAGVPAAELWDGTKTAGEITILVEGRFAVMVEAQKADSLDTLRAVLAGVNVKALAALK